MKRSRAPIVGVLVLVLGMVSAAPAFAGGGRVEPVSGGFEDYTPGALSTVTATPKHGCPQTSCTSSSSTPPAPVDSGSGERYFWNSPASFRMPAPFATTGGAGTGVVTVTWSYAQLAGAASCPGPLTGAAGSMPVLNVPTPRNIAASFSWVEYGSNDTYLWLDMTNPALPVIKQATFGSSDYNFVWACRSYTPPTIKTTTCAKVGSYQLMGPFDRSGDAMAPVSLGGSNTRVVNAEETTVGLVKFGSSLLGDTIATRPAVSAAASVWSTYLSKVQTTAATKDNIYRLCLATEADLSLQGQTSEEIDSYGRYYDDTQIWRDQVRYYVFNSYGISVPVLSHLWPAIYGTADWHAASGGYLPVYVDSAAPMNRDDRRAFYAIHCASNTASSRVTRDTVPAGSGWAGGAWNAVEGSDEQFYSYQCMSTIPDPTRTDDLLVCDRYAAPVVQPYQYQTMPYTYGSPQRVSIYDEWWMADGGGNYDDGNTWKSCTYYPVEPWPGGTHWGCSRGHYETVPGGKDPTPAGWTDSGTGWYRKLAPPTGFVDDGTQYVNYNYANVIVDHKFGAPIAGAVPNRFASTGIYDANMTGDRYRFQWVLPRINLTATGQDVTTITGSDVRWRARFKLDDSSSPILVRDPSTGGAPSGGKNDSGQPYHLFLDTTPGSSADNPGPFLSWSPFPGAWSGSVPSVPVDRWSPARTAAWLDQARTLWLRFFASSTSGRGWTLTPWWEVTVTVPVTSTSPTMGAITSDGDWILGMSASKTETRRQTYECPGQPLRTVVDGVASGPLGEYQALS